MTPRFAFVICFHFYFLPFTESNLSSYNAYLMLPLSLALSHLHVTFLLIIKHAI